MMWNLQLPQNLCGCRIEVKMYNPCLYTPGYEVCPMA